LCGKQGLALVLLERTHVQAKHLPIQRGAAACQGEEEGRTTCTPVAENEACERKTAAEKTSRLVQSGKKRSKNARTQPGKQSA